MTRSKLANYKRRIKYILIKQYKWKEERIDLWFADNHNYLQAMSNSMCSSTKTAQYISEMKSGDHVK